MEDSKTGVGDVFFLWREYSEQVESRRAIQAHEWLQVLCQRCKVCS